MDDTLTRGPMLLLSGRANRPLSLEMGELLDADAEGATVRDFADGEIFVRINENARGRDVFIIQPTNAPGDSIMELLLLIDAAKRASAARVTAGPTMGMGGRTAKISPGWRSVPSSSRT